LGAILVVVAAASSTAQVGVEVRTVDREPLTGELVQFSLHEGLILRPEAAAEPLSISPRDIVRITPLAAAADHPRGPIRLLLDTGDVLYGQLSGHGPEKFVLDTILGNQVAVPFERVQLLTTQLAEQRRWSGAIGSLSSAPRDEDVVLLSNGDMVKGLLSRLDPQMMTLERAGGERQIDFAVTVALFLANEPRSAPDGVHAWLRFADGSSLGASEVHWTPAGLDVSCFDGTFQGLSQERLRDLEIRGARWSWLGQDVPLAGSEHTAQLSLTWPARQDSNAIGGRLRLRGSTFERGYGVHSRSVLTFDLDGRYTAFSTICGLDDAAGEYADVAAAVVVDGVVAWENPSITRSQAPQQLHLDVSGAKALQLQVDFGANGDLQDYFDWADAALIQ
jgi:hypothetical protein